MLAQVNQVRSQHSLRSLRFHPTLWIAARDHSIEQDRHRYMGHGSPDPSRRELSQRMALAGYRGSVFAEVVAWGYPDVASVVEGWMNSPDHRRILLDPELTEAGFSRVGEYWTGNFGAPRRYRAISAPRPRRAPTTTFRQQAPSPTPRRATPAPRPYRAAPTPVPVAKPTPTPRRPVARPRAVPAPAPAQPFTLQPKTGFG